MIMIAELNGEASNHDALSFHVMYVCMYVCMYIRSLRNAILCLCVCIRNACAIQSYVHVCISVMLCAMLAQQQGQNVPRGDNCGLSGGKFAQQVPIASVGRLAAYVALTAVLARYAKDKGAFITARQRVGQTIEDLRHSGCAHGRYISSEMP